VIIHFNPPKILSPAGKSERKNLSKNFPFDGKNKKGAFKSPC